MRNHITFKTGGTCQAKKVSLLKFLLSWLSWCILDDLVVEIELCHLKKNAYLFLKVCSKQLKTAHLVLLNMK